MHSQLYENAPIHLPGRMRTNTTLHVQHQPQNQPKPDDLQVCGYLPVLASCCPLSGNHENSTSCLLAVVCCHNTNKVSHTALVLDQLRKVQSHLFLSSTVKQSSRQSSATSQEAGPLFAAPPTVPRGMGPPLERIAFTRC